MYLGLGIMHIYLEKSALFLLLNIHASLFGEDEYPCILRKSGLQGECRGKRNESAMLFLEEGMNMEVGYF